jgi:hypothetical protein
VGQINQRLETQVQFPIKEILAHPMQENIIVIV